VFEQKRVRVVAAAAVGVVLAGGIAYGAAGSGMAPEVQNRDETAAYAAAVAEHERLIGQTLALELAGERARPDRSVVARAGLVEGYIAEHERIIVATLGGVGDLSVGHPSHIGVTAASARVADPRPWYIQEHEALMAPVLARHQAGSATSATEPAAAVTDAFASLPWYAQEHEALIRGTLGGLD
jgi:hypothetical protein